MKHYIFAGYLLVLMIGDLGNATRLHADSLTVESYLNLTIARMKFVAMTLEKDQRGTTEDDLVPLLKQANTTREEYYAFASERSSEIEEFFQSHPEVNEFITALSLRINNLIEQGETNRVNSR